MGSSLGNSHRMLNVAVVAMVAVFEFSWSASAVDALMPATLTHYLSDAFRGLCRSRNSV